MSDINALQERFQAFLEGRLQVAEDKPSPAFCSALNRKLTDSRVEVVSMSKDGKSAQALITDLKTNKTRTAHMKRTMFGTFMDARGREYYLD